MAKLADSDHVDSVKLFQGDELMEGFQLNGKQITANEYLKLTENNAAYLPFEKNGKIRSAIILQDNATRIEALEEYYHLHQHLHLKSKGLKSWADQIDKVKLCDLEIDAARYIQRRLIETKLATPKELRVSAQQNHSCLAA